MIIVYSPAGGEPEHYDASTLRVSEAGIVQRTVDMKWGEIKAGLESDDLDAMRGIVWVLKKRSQPSLRFGEFDPGVDELTTRLDQREAASYVDNAFAACAADEELTPEIVAGILRSRLPDIAIDPEHARRLIDAGEQAPKEVAAQEESGAGEASSPSPTSSGPETPTSASSPTSSTSHPEPSMT